MTSETAEEQSYWVASWSISTLWNQLDRGWKATIVGAGFLLLTLANVQIPW